MTPPPISDFFRMPPPPHQSKFLEATFLCVFRNKEITSYNKNIVQLIFQLGSINSRNLSPLTELITKAIEETTSVWRKIGAKPYEVTEPRTSELVNLLFSCQTGIQSVSIRLRLRLTN